MKVVLRKSGTLWFALPLLFVIGVIGAVVYIPLIVPLIMKLWNEGVPVKGASYLGTSFARSCIYCGLIGLMFYLFCCTTLYSFVNLSRWLKAGILISIAANCCLGYVVRLYLYILIVRPNGLLDSVVPIYSMWKMHSLLMYSQSGVIISLAYLYLPYGMLPLLSYCAITRDSSLEYLKMIPSGVIYKSVVLTRFHLFPLVISCTLASMFLVFADFICSDLIGGGKNEAFGKAVYRTAIRFRRPDSAIMIGGVLYVLFVCAVSGAQRAAHIIRHKSRYS